MLRLQRLELRILRYIRTGSTAGWSATTVPDLGNATHCQNWTELTDALKQLHKQGVMEMRKWIEPKGFVTYSGAENDEGFFYRADFQVKITPEGRPYFEALEEKQRFEKLGTVDFASVQDQLKTIRDAMQPIEELKKLTGMPLPLRNLGHVFDQMEQARKALVGKFSFPDLNALSRPLAEHQKISELLKPIVESYGNIGAQLTGIAQAHNQRWRELFAGVAAPRILHDHLKLTKALQQINLQLPTIVPNVWPPNILAQRLSLIENSLRNVQVFEELQKVAIESLPRAHWDIPQINRLGLAGQFVFDYGTFVRRLPPRVPAEEQTVKEEEEFRRRDEEVGPRLEAKLEQMDHRLVELRRSAWEALARGDAGGLRLAAHGIREVYGEVLRRLAPDQELKQTEIWKDRKDRSLRKPTRRMRIEFIAGRVAKELDALVQFDTSIGQAHKFAHTFEGEPDVVRVYMAQLENCTYLLLTCAKGKKN